MERSTHLSKVTHLFAGLGPSMVTKIVLVYASFKIKHLSLTVSYITKLTILCILLHMFAEIMDSPKH